MKSLQILSVINQRLHTATKWQYSVRQNSAYRVKIVQRKFPVQDALTFRT